MNRIALSAAATTPDRIVELGYAFRAAKTLMSAVELGVFTTLAAGPLARDTLMQGVGLDQRGAADFLDALVALRLLDRDQNGRYRNMPEADLYLDRNKPTYVGGLLDHINTSEYPRWMSLTAALRTGKPQTGAGSVGNFPAKYADRASLEIFVRGMTGGSVSAAKALACRFPWRDHATFLDIGTAQGCVPVLIAQAHPHLAGGGFDLPPVEPVFKSYVRQHGLSDRLTFHPGDFFTDRLPAAEVLVMGRVLHNWDLPTKRMLLRKAHAALPAGGTVIVYERLIDDARRESAAGLLSSLNMLVMTAGGFDFTAVDCIGWMRDAGFQDMRIEPLTAEQSMVIGRK